MNSNLSTVDKVKLVVGNKPLPFVVYGGKKNSTPISYLLTIVQTKPLRIEVSTISYKTSKGEKIVNNNVILTITSDVGKLFTHLTDLPLSKTEIFKIETKQYAFHSQVVVDLAMPYWIKNAQMFVENNDIAPSWLLLANLWLDVKQQDTDNINEVNTAASFTVDQWYSALVRSHKQLPTNKQLNVAVTNIPDSHKHLLKAASNQTVNVVTVTKQESDL